MIQKVLWTPPSLCGCQLSITADFLDKDVVNNASYRHPKPFTITDVEIVNVCATHQPNTLAMPDTSVFFDAIDPASYQGQLAAMYPKIVPSIKQNRGYLSYPIANPTPAECLYTFLTQYGGQVNSLPCGCAAFQFVDEKKNVSYLEHPVHTNKCQFHPNDTINMQQAMADFNAIQNSAANIPPGG